MSKKVIIDQDKTNALDVRHVLNFVRMFLDLMKTRKKPRSFSMREDLRTAFRKQ